MAAVLENKLCKMNGKLPQTVLELWYTLVGINKDIVSKGSNVCDSEIWSGWEAGLNGVYFADFLCSFLSIKFSPFVGESKIFA